MTASSTGESLKDLGKNVEPDGEVVATAVLGLTGGTVRLDCCFPESAPFGDSAVANALEYVVAVVFVAGFRFRLRWAFRLTSTV